MKTVTLTFYVPKKKAEAVRAGLHKRQIRLKRFFRLRQGGEVTLGPDPVYVTISLEPTAIRDHFDAHYDREEFGKLSELSDEQLYDAASQFLLNTDAVWERFHDWCCDIVRLAAESNA
jgi:hypothetical protein